MGCCCTRIAVLCMDTALKAKHIHIHIPPTRSPSPTNHVTFVMPLANTRIFIANTNKSNHQKLFCIKNIIMAQQENKGTQFLNVDKEKKEEKKEESPSESIPPPPPEKPLPGDCCGSGCVRCVWDVYYDELEDYNKLYVNVKADSKR